jgi:hypothetical protein
MHGWRGREAAPSHAGIGAGKTGRAAYFFTENRYTVVVL